MWICRSTFPSCIRLVTIHSFTPVYRGVSRPWHAGILFDKAEAFGHELVEKLNASDRRTFDNSVPTVISPPPPLKIVEATAPSTNDDDDGVDVSLIRWMLSLTPSERLDVLQGFVDSVFELRRS